MNIIEERIRTLDKEIEAYRQAITDAEGSLDAAEKELNEVLSEVNFEFNATENLEGGEEA